MVLVKNILGTSDNDAPSGFSSWKEYWESSMRRKFSKCACDGCTNSATVGGHVVKLYGGHEWYIVPLCSRHNNVNYDRPYSVPQSEMLRVR